MSESVEDLVKKGKRFEAIARINQSRVIGEIIGDHYWSRLDRTILWVFVLYTLVKPSFWVICLVVLLRLILRTDFINRSREEFERITRMHLDKDVRDVDC